MSNDPDRDPPPTEPRSPEVWSAVWLGYASWQVDPDYERWRAEHFERCDADYRAWRRERFGDDFERWRSERGGTQSRSTPDPDPDPQLLFERS